MTRVRPPTDIWLIAGTWTHTRYPCRCELGRRCRTSTTDPNGHPAYWCPCWGRTDGHLMRTHCCAYRIPPPPHPEENR